jgi:hypothetical protein
MPPAKKPPTFDQLLALINTAPSVADLAALLVTARTYFMGNQREQLEAAIAKRESELPNGEALGR